MLVQPPYLTLKRAAQILGVHEQTLRAWERQGLIRMARLPKSGYRRVPAEEVERLKTAMMTRSADSGVRLAAPRVDAESLRQAEALAEAVRAELASLEDDGTLDTFLASRRGRAWLP